MSEPTTRELGERIRQLAQDIAASSDRSLEEVLAILRDSLVGEAAPVEVIKTDPLPERASPAQARRTTCTTYRGGLGETENHGPGPRLDQIEGAPPGAVFVCDCGASRWAVARLESGSYGWAQL